MEQVARMAYLPSDIDNELIGLSEQTQVNTSTIVRECVRLVFGEDIVRNELLRRLEIIKQKDFQRSSAELQVLIERAAVLR